MTTPPNNPIRGITGSTIKGVLLGPNVVLKKSAKGRDEIVTHSHKLALSLRRILILVDGDQTIASITELTELTSGLAGLEENLSLLIDLGFLEVSGLRVDETQTLQIIAAPAPQVETAPATKIASDNATSGNPAAKPTAAKSPLVPSMQVTPSTKAKKADAAGAGAAQQRASYSDPGPVSGFQEKLIIARGEGGTNSTLGPSSEPKFVAKNSELIRLANEGAIKKAVEHAVAVDNSLTIPPSSHYKKLAEDGLVAVSKKTMSPEKLNAAKAALVVEARRLLGADAERLIPKIQTVQTVDDVMDWVMKFREYFLLTGKDEAENFVSRFQNMLR